MPLPAHFAVVPLIGLTLICVCVDSLPPSFVHSRVTHNIKSFRQPVLSARSRFCSGRPWQSAVLHQAKDGEATGEMKQPTNAVARLSAGVFPAYGLVVLLCGTKALFLLKGGMEHASGWTMWKSALFTDAVVFFAMSIFFVEFALKAKRQLAGAAIASRTEDVVQQKRVSTFSNLVLVKIVGETVGAALMFELATGTAAVGIAAALFAHALFISLANVSISPAGEVKDLPFAVRKFIMLGDTALAVLALATAWTAGSWGTAPAVLLLAASVANLAPHKSSS